jgi:hypothetical protein
VWQKNHGKQIMEEKVWQTNRGRKSAAEKVRQKNHGRKIAAAKSWQKNCSNITPQEEKGMVFICVVLNL